MDAIHFQTINRDADSCNGEAVRKQNESRLVRLWIGTLGAVTILLQSKSSECKLHAAEAPGPSRMRTLGGKVKRNIWLGIVVLAFTLAAAWREGGRNFYGEPGWVE